MINGERASENYLIQIGIRQQRRIRQGRFSNIARNGGTCPISKVSVIPQNWTYAGIHMRRRQMEKVKLSEGLKLQYFLKSIDEQKSS